MAFDVCYRPRIPFSQLGNVDFPWESIVIYDVLQTDIHLLCFPHLRPRFPRNKQTMVSSAIRLTDLPTGLLVCIGEEAEFEDDLNSFVQTSRRLYVTTSEDLGALDW